MDARRTVVEVDCLCGAEFAMCYSDYEENSEHQVVRYIDVDTGPRDCYVASGTTTVLDDEDELEEIDFFTPYALTAEKCIGCHPDLFLPMPNSENSLTLDDFILQPHAPIPRSSSTRLTIHKANLFTGLDVFMGYPVAETFEDIEDIEYTRHFESQQIRDMYPGTLFNLDGAATNIMALPNDFDEMLMTMDTTSGSPDSTSTGSYYDAQTMDAAHTLLLLSQGESAKMTVIGDQEVEAAHTLMTIATAEVDTDATSAMEAVDAARTLMVMSASGEADRASETDEDGDTTMTGIDYDTESISDFEL